MSLLAAPLAALEFVHRPNSYLRPCSRNTSQSLNQFSFRLNTYPWVGPEERTMRKQPKSMFLKDSFFNLSNLWSAQLPSLAANS
jgi:hypothetical protein